MQSFAVFYYELGLQEHSQGIGAVIDYGPVFGADGLASALLFAEVSQADFVGVAIHVGLTVVAGGLAFAGAVVIASAIIAAAGAGAAAIGVFETLVAVGAKAGQTEGRLALIVSLAFYAQGFVVFAGVRAFVGGELV